MAATKLYLPESGFDHDTGGRHPESAGRLEAVKSTLAEPRFKSLGRGASVPATTQQIEAVHVAGYFEGLQQSLPAEGHTKLDQDTLASHGSAKAALEAAGVVCDAVKSVIEGAAKNAFCAVRPPGHHAEPDRPMGFCLMNNAAMAARYAQTFDGINKVAVVDFDVHHGNGTQAMFERDASLFYASSHQFPFYPGTGTIAEQGVGNICNAPLPANAEGTVFRDAWESALLPGLKAFGPDLLIISAGFDGHANDPIGGIRLEDADFIWVTEKLLHIAEHQCNSMVVSTLEGGYDLDTLARCVGDHVDMLASA